MLCAMLLAVSGTAMAQRLPQSYIVRLRPGFTAKDVRGLTDALRARLSTSATIRPVFSSTASEAGALMSANRLDRYMVLDVPSGASADAAGVLGRSDLVEEIFPNHRYHVDARFNDSLLGEQWALGKVEAEGAWKSTIGDSSVIVGIVDTGIDFTHPDLEHALAINAAEDINHNGRFDPWPVGEVRDGVRGDIDFVDQDGNGLADDVIGYDFVDQVVPNVGDWSGRDPIPEDEFGHGTNVAGIIAATPDNRIGIAGLAPGVRLLSLRAFDASGNGEDDDISAAIVYAADRGARVINMSFGDLFYSPLMRDAIAYAHGKGVVMAASSGNNGAPDVHFPSSYPEVIAVGATDEADRRTTFSSYGPQLSLVAPGSSILTTGLDGDYVTFGGTSASAPHVSAAAALLLSLHPTWTPEEVRTTLELAADDLGARGWDIFFGSGRLNVRRALESRGPASIAIASPQIDEGYSRDTTVVVRGSAASVFLESWSLELGAGEDPSSWRPLGEAHREGRLLDSLGSFSTRDLADGVYMLRLRLRETNGREAERRVRLFVDRTPPKLSPAGSLAVRNVWRFDEHALAITLRTDDLTRAVLWLRRADRPSEPFRPLELETERTGLTHGHFLLVTGGEMEGDVPYQGYIRLTNVAGDTTLVGSPGAPIELKRERAGFPINTFEEKSYSLPIGFTDGHVAPIFGDKDLSIALNRFKNGSFDRLFLYSFNGKEFVARDSTGTWVPRGFGDVDGNGRRELLGQLRGSSILFEQTSRTASPMTSVKFVDSTSGDFYASGFYDFDKDGRDEVIARTEPRAGVDGYYFVAGWDGSTLRQLAQLPNPTPPASDEAQNQLGSSESAVGDFDGDGNPEILYGDNDADFIVYERQPDGTFTFRWSDLNEGEEGSRMVAAGDLDGDGRDEVIVGYHSRSLMNADNEYDAPLWTIKVFELDAAGTATLLWSTEVAYLRATDIFRAGLSAGDLDGVPGAELAISVFPNLYVLRWDPVARTMVPLWWHGGSISNRPIIADFDRDGRAEVGTGDGQRIRFFQIDSAAAPLAPGGIHAWATSDTSAHVEWGPVAGATGYTLFRGVRVPDSPNVDFLPVLQTASLSAEDTGLETEEGHLTAGVEYVYFVSATDPTRPRQESGPSEFVSVVPHAPARALAASARPPRAIRIDFDTELAEDLYRPGAVAVSRAPGGEPVEVSSITSEGRTALLINLAAEHPGDSLQVRATWLLRDLLGTPADTTTALGVRMPAAEQPGDRFIATRASYGGGDTIVIDFNRDLDPATALDAANYTLEPAGAIRQVSLAPGRSDRVLLIVADDYPLGPYGNDYTITIRNVRSGVAQPLNDGAGSVVGFTLASGDLGSVFVYPHPFSLSRDQRVTFAGLTRRAKITIYTRSGVEVGVIDAREGNGGASWDGRDQSGATLPTGIYLYEVTGTNDAGEPISSGLRKLAIVP